MHSSLRQKVLNMLNLVKLWMYSVKKLLTLLKKLCVKHIILTVYVRRRLCPNLSLRGWKETTVWMGEKDVSLPPKVFGSFDRHISHSLTALSIAPGCQVWLTASRWWLNGVVRATVNQPCRHGNRGGNTAACGDPLFYQSNTRMAEHFHTNKTYKINVYVIFSSIPSCTRCVSRIWYGLQNLIKTCITCMVTLKTRYQLHACKMSNSTLCNFRYHSFIMLIAPKQNPGQVCHLGLNWYSPSGSIRCVNYTTNWCVIAFNNCCFEMSIRCFNYGWNGYSEAPLRGTVNMLVLMMTSIPVKQWISIRHQMDFMVLWGSDY